ncbi:MAG: tetratricopeptide repeat protein [bacterium]|nr:tetratricopeptide repeat protein [bacterium]
MTVTYRVSIEGTNKKNLFNICWFNPVSNREENINSFTPGFDIKHIDSGSLWQNRKKALDTGHKLFVFLDGESGLLRKALKEASDSSGLLVLNLFTNSDTHDWPFELIAFKNSFLIQRELHLVRRVKPIGESNPLEPRDHSLNLLFMASSPLDVQPVLAFEKEEETIFKVTEELAMDLEVEDSGTLEGLQERLLEKRYDVVHISGHADIKGGNPFFLLEDETGKRRDAGPARVWSEALKENPPMLLFLSGCRTGEAARDGAVVSFARMMAEEYDIPAVLGWAREVCDVQAAAAAEVIYRELSRGQSILDSVKRAQCELMERFPNHPSPAWPLLRLYASDQQLNALVQKGQKQRLKPRSLKHTYLKNSRVKILKEGFVGRRRQLQQCLRVLKQENEKVGVLIHGTGGLGKSCLAGKVCERFPNHGLIVLHGKLNSLSLQNAFHFAFAATGDKNGIEILAEKKELPEKIQALCASSFKNSNYLLLLDDFEQNFEGAEEGAPGPLNPVAAELLGVLLEFLPLSGKKTQMIITSRYMISSGKISARPGRLYKRLVPVSLTGLLWAEQIKMFRELKHIFEYPDRRLGYDLLFAGYGNPRLMEWLDTLVGELSEAGVDVLLKAVGDKQEAFIRDHVIRELLKQGGEDMERLLRVCSIYCLPVLENGVYLQGKAVSIKEPEIGILVERSLGLGLLEHDKARESFLVMPLLREELLCGLDEKTVVSCHRAAYDYYKGICKGFTKKGKFDADLVEEWVYHALGCGEEETATRQGGKLVGYLRDNLAYRESLRIGSWVLGGKKSAPATKTDASFLRELASVRGVLGENRRAIEHYEQSLKITRDLLGNVHPDVAIDLNNIGAAWNELGKKRKAIGYFEQALKISKDYYGERHPNVATSLNNLGGGWVALGEKRRAIEYYEQALKIDRSVWGNKHPDVAIRLNNIGAAWDELGENQRAIGFYEEALNIERALLGNEHPSVAIDLNNLGAAYKDLGQNERAIEYFEEALKIDRVVFGNDHPNVAIRLNNLGTTLDALGRKRQAITYLEEALKIERAFYGNEHPNVATHINNLGEAFRTLGEPRKAIEYYEQALKIDRAAFGNDHPKVAIRLNNLGAALSDLGEHLRAIEYYEQALKTLMDMYGEKHPNIATALNNLGTAYLDQGQKDKAKGYFEKAFAIFNEILGPQHPNTSVVFQSLLMCSLRLPVE